MSKPYQLGLALSGGGARGIAHIGVLQALDDYGIKPDILAGTSAGAIAAALYASGKSPSEMLALVKEASLFKLFKVGLPYAGLTKHTYLLERLQETISEDSFEALNIPCHIAITNLQTGACEIKKRGRLFDVIAASSAIPLIFQPVEIDDQQYVDGGLLANMPVAAIRDEATFVVGVNVMPTVTAEKGALKNVFGIAQRCFDLSLLANTQPSIDLCDLLIEPREIRKYTILNLNKYQEIHDIGYAAMEAKIPELERNMESMGKLI
ncbi:MAG: patatin-like phospholipase family protein [Mameliella sp.]|nr:patatin-like phospholipase family protein [Phaeodactylibacter sp.]NRA48708.1 patatin-like phospholipase family protein [Phaeodactylibacter sp.]